VSVTASSSVWKEAVIAPFRIGWDRALLLVLPILPLTLVSGAAYSQQANRQPPSVSKKKPASLAAVSPDDELLRRLQAQRAAVGKGDAAAVEQASRQVTALVLRQMASLRVLEGAFPQAVELYRQ